MAAKLGSPQSWEQHSANQKAHFRSLSCIIRCTGAEVEPGPGAKTFDPCRVTGAPDVAVLNQSIQARTPVGAQVCARYLNRVMQERVLVLDGPVSAELATRKFTEAQYRGGRFGDSKVSLEGNSDLLTLTQPEAVVQAHKQYLTAGADVCRTNTLHATAIDQGPYRTHGLVYELNKTAAELAKQAAAEASQADPSKPRLVAGSMGPTSQLLSKGAAWRESLSQHASQRKHSSQVSRALAPECKQSGKTTDRFGHVGEPDTALAGKYFSSKCWRIWEKKPSAVWPENGVFPQVTFDELVEVYLEQLSGLVDGGVDLLALDAVADTLNAKAALTALDEYYAQFDKEPLPLIISASLPDSNGRMKAGQSIEAFCISVKHAKPLSIGIDGVLSEVHQKALAKICPFWCHACPASAEASDLQKRAASLNMVGGGSGALPSFIETVARTLRGTSRRLPMLESIPSLALAGLEPCYITSEAGVQLVGQRCNLSGSAYFRDLVYACRFQSAVGICKEQIQHGADILDISLDSAWSEFDAQSAMGTFLALCGIDPDVAKVPVAISTSDWDVMEAGLRHVQGKCIVSSLALSEGEDGFLRTAASVKRYGAAMVVRAATEEQKDGDFSADEKISVCQRAYELLRSRLDFPPEDIIFDCVLLPLGTEGLQPNRCQDFLSAVETLKRSCPGVSFIGGLGNLSTAYRHVPEVRQALHSTFLSQAVPVGLNLAIVSPGELPLQNEVEPLVWRTCQEAVRNASADGSHAERLKSLGVTMAGAHGELAIYGGDEAAPIQPLPEPREGLLPITTVVQSAGALSANTFIVFGTKSAAAWHIYRMCQNLEVTRSIHFSSISVWMGQGGSAVNPAASGILDATAQWCRWQMLDNKGTTVQWGPIGDIGLRRVIYGSKDVFAHYDIGQKLVSAADSAAIERAMFAGAAPEFLSIAYVTDDTKTEWEGKVLIKVRDQDVEISFRVRPNTPMSRLEAAYIKAKQDRRLQVQLASRGVALAPTDTFESLSLSNGAVIDAIPF